MIEFIKIFLRYFFLILFAFLFDCVFNKIVLNIVYNLIENTLFAVALICPLYFITNNKLNKYYFSVSYLLFSFCVFFETIYYYLFKTNFSSSAIFVALDSNIDEVKEFLGFYVNTPIVVFTLLILTITSISLFKIKKLNITSLLYTSYSKFKILILFVAILVFFKLSSLIVFNLPYSMIKFSFEYYADFKRFGDYKNNKTGSFVNVFRAPKEVEKEVYIIILGESTSRFHMSIYDYYRKTTPLLKEIENELLIYKNVISPHTYTIACLGKGLTLSNYENPELKYKGSIIQLLNQAKFKTYWISNQRPVGMFDSHATKIGLGADKSFFLNLKHTDESTVFDEALVEQLDEVLLEKGDKKIIFLHMLGAHLDYKKRYPENFNYFKSIPKTKFENVEAYSAINSYDNAIRYSDYIIRKVIESMKQLKVNSFVLYFSDHGEEVYDEIDFSGHSADQIITKNIYEIPMFLWLSDAYKSSKKINNNLDLKYMTDDLFHSIADLCNVKSNEVDSTRSIFSKHFKERKRIIRDTIDYDIYFN